MYIDDDDDLISQFPQPPRCGSRLFSIGSVSTVDHGCCPLDKRGVPGYNEEITTQDSENEKSAVVATTATSAQVTAVDDETRSRSTYEQEATPTKTLTHKTTRVRADSCGPRAPRRLVEDASPRRHSTVKDHIRKHSRHVSAADVAGSALAVMDEMKQTEKQGVGIQLSGMSLMILWDL